jgi:prepilin-type N-terminal cleavage/methylation domain-containing protein
LRKAGKFAFSTVYYSGGWRILMRQHGFTLVETIIVIVILILLAMIAAPNLIRAKYVVEAQKIGITDEKAQLAYAEQRVAEVSKPGYHEQKTEVAKSTIGGGDGMFRFIETFVFFAILWIIANLLHYVFIKSTGWDANDAPMAWVFGLSNGWLKQERDKKNEKQPKEKGKGGK